MHITRTASPLPQAVELLDYGVRQTWLATEHFGGSRAVYVSEVTVPPATTHLLREHDGEYICVLVEGTAQLLVNDAQSAIAYGAVVHSRSGGEFSVIAGTQGVKLLTFAAAETRKEDSGRPSEPTPVETFSLYDITDGVLHRPQAGFIHMGTRMLLNSDHGGYSSFVFGQSTFAPVTGVHVLHRHLRADEMFYVWEGAGAHLGSDGTEHPMGVGDAVFVPRAEWHGFTNTSNRPVRAFFCLLGTGSMLEAGNEVLEDGVPRNVFKIVEPH